MPDYDIIEDDGRMSGVVDGDEEDAIDEWLLEYHEMCEDDEPLLWCEEVTESEPF